MNIFYIINNQKPQLYIEMIDIHSSKNKKNKYFFVKDFNTFYDVMFNTNKFKTLFYEL